MDLEPRFLSLCTRPDATFPGKPCRDAYFCRCMDTDLLHGKAIRELMVNH